MPHFLIEEEEISNGIITLENNDNFFHICRVLRAKINEDIKFIDSKKNIYYSKITQITKNSLSAKIISVSKSSRFLEYNLNLVQCVLMTDAQNLAIANASQTGVKKLYPVISDNVSVKKNILKDKKDKWQKIASENFKQCERADVMEIMEISSLFEILEKFDKNNVIIYVEKDENEELDKAVAAINKNKPIAVVIGPEGGFSDDEFNKFKEENYKLVSLGKLIYKAPNAITAGVSNIVSRLK